MIYTFNRPEVLRLVAITKAAKSCSVPYTGGEWERISGRAKETTPGLVPVGDQGVYMMSNADDQKKEGDHLPLAYANEVNPEKLEFDVWWAAKRAGFGGDDGCNFVPLSEIERWLANTDGSMLRMRISSQSFTLLPTRGRRVPTTKSKPVE